MASSDLFFVDRSARDPASTSPDDKAPPPSNKRRAPPTPTAAAWVDDDDVDKDSGTDGGDLGRGGGGGGGSGTGDGSRAVGGKVDLKGVPQRRKLRKSATERSVSTAEYQQRVREYYAKEGSRIAAGTWAELPSQRQKKRRRSREVASPAGGDDEGDDSSAGDGGDDVGVNDHVSRLLRSTGTILSARASTARGASTLSAGVIDIRRVADANRADPNRAVVQAVEFHPSGRLFLTAGMDRTMRIFQVDGKRNPKIQGVHLQDLPITAAHFTAGGDEIIMTGRRAFFYQFDLGTGAATRVETLSRGRDALKSLEDCVVSPDGQRLAVIGGKGRVLLVSNKCKQQTGVLRMDVPCGAAAFSAQDENHIYTTGKGGAVFLWDVRQQACVDRHLDEGSLMGTALASASSHYAIGSSSGVVNVYRNSAMRGVGDRCASRGGDRREAPERALMNLTTGISSLAFNADGQLLAMSSRAQKNAVRLVHVPTMTVYANWPTQNVNLRRVSCLAFSPSGGFLAAGNDKGEALLFRVRNGYSAF
jgi:U3 small nucleolar RNA-associated protein 18